MTLTLVDPSTSPARAYATSYDVTIVVDGERALEESSATASERLTDIVDWLLETYDEVDLSDVNETLAPFGGANAPAALDAVLALYADSGVDDFDMYLSERRRDVGPQRLYTVLTDYTDGTVFVEHYPSAEERLTALRQRALTVDDRHPAEAFLTADEALCKTVIDAALASSGRLLLFEADRAAEGETYMSFGSSRR